MRRLRQSLNATGPRYVLIGGSVYAFELLVIVLAQRWGASAVWAAAVSFCLGTAASFFLQKLVTFGDKRMHHRILIPQLIATALLILWNLGFSVLLAQLLQHRVPTVLARTLALGITTVWNFYLYKTRIFAGRDGVVFS